MKVGGVTTLLLCLYSFEVSDNWLFSNSDNGHSDELAAMVD